MAEEIITESIAAFSLLSDEEKEMLDFLTNLDEYTDADIETINERATYNAEQKMLSRGQLQEHEDVKDADLINYLGNRLAYFTAAYQEWKNLQDKING